MLSPPPSPPPPPETQHGNSIAFLKGGIWFHPGGFSARESMFPIISWLFTLSCQPQRSLLCSPEQNPLTPGQYLTYLCQLDVGLSGGVQHCVLALWENYTDSFHRG
ncbi:mCG147250 [Mus musculus]|nr:mCG147250 [Mus musculus]